MNSDFVAALTALLPPAAKAESANQNTLLSITNLSVAFRGISALTGVTATVGESEVVAIIGPNGAGKTTLLNAVSGVVGGSVTGSITLDGEEIARLTPSAIASRGISRSFQHPPFLEAESVIDNVMVASHLRLGYTLLDQVVRPRHVARIERSERDRAADLLDCLGLGGFVDRNASQLPYGLIKRVDIARAVFCAPRLLLLDEPTSGLDAGEQREITELVIALASACKITIVLVEHHMDIVRSCASRVVALQAGSILGVGTPSEVLDSSTFRNVMVGTEADADA